MPQALSRKNQKFFASEIVTASATAPWKNDSPANRFAIEVVEQLRAHGFQALWAGGCVRDLFLGKPPSDYDVATDAVPEQVMKLFRKTVPVGISFGVVRVLGPVRGLEIEVATFRSDGRYLDGRRPEEVRFSSAQEDASRRDFSINGMFLDPLSGQIIDYVGGQNDLETGIIRAIGDPFKRFEEDKLRLLRAVRFAARFGFQVETETASAIETLAPHIQVVAAERIGQEMMKILQHPSRGFGLHLMKQTGLLKEIFPEIHAQYDRPHSRAREPQETTMGEHLKEVLQELEIGPESGPVLALAALLHEVTESEPVPAQLSSPPYKPSFSGLGQPAQIAFNIGARLRLPRAESEHLAWLIDHLNAFETIEAWSPAQRKRLLIHSGRADLITLFRADAQADGRSTQPADFCEDYVAHEPEGPIDPPLLLNGHDLQVLEIAPGPRFKKILEQGRDEQLNGHIHTREEALTWLKDHVRAS